MANDNSMKVVFQSKKFEKETIIFHNNNIYIKVRINVLWNDFFVVVRENLRSF